MTGFTKRWAHQLYLAFLAAMVVLMASYMVTPVGGATYSYRAVSCHAFDFFPVVGSVQYGQDAAGRYLLTSGFVACDPHLPHKAIVTKVEFTIKDNDGTGLVQNCALVRSPLEAASANAFQVMAAVPGTTASGALGHQRLSTTAITNATVDNTRFAYFLQCEIFLGTRATWTGIFGANVNYKITVGNG